MAAIVADVFATTVAWWSLCPPRLVFSPELALIHRGFAAREQVQPRHPAPIRSAHFRWGDQRYPVRHDQCRDRQLELTTDRNWHGYIDFAYLWNRVLDLGARRVIRNNPYQFVKPRLSGRTYVADGTTAPAPPLADSGKGSIVIAIAS